MMLGAPSTTLFIMNALPASHDEQRARIAQQHWAATAQDRLAVEVGNWGAWPPADQTLRANPQPFAVCAGPQEGLTDVQRERRRVQLLRDKVSKRHKLA